MIRFAANSDIVSMISLWIEAFGDSEEDIGFFIDNKFIPENTIVYDDNGAIVSMLFLLEGNLTLKGTSYPSYYLYAACTAKECRGRGIMAMLLEKAKEITAERNKFFICLMPAEESLFGFYERFGYKSIFSRKILNVSSHDFKNIADEAKDFKNIDYADLRKNAFKNYDRFDWGNDSILFACKHHQHYGGKCFSTCKGYALYTADNKYIRVKEFAFPSSELNRTTSFLMSDTGLSECTVSLPAAYPTDIGKYTTVKSAMALPVKQEYEKLIKGIENAYLGLTLD